MRSPLKFTVESGGVAFNKTGGNVSLGPPEGGIILAQPVGTLIQNALTTIKIRAVTKNFFMQRVQT